MYQELKYYLISLKSLIPQLDLDKKLYKEGTTIGQVVFHCCQSANYWTRVVILKQNFKRDREAEFKDSPTPEQINDSLDLAIKACGLLEEEKPDLGQKLEKPIKLMPVNIEAKTKLDAFIHVLAHTAEHYGELFQTTR
ncbi:MAG TPA: hypothetical protein VJG66_03055 [Patescibacteria group bacterium]|nr:hypothetical protein [Patescibacteria group bacterium]